VDKFHRKEEWPKMTVQGDKDFSGNPPYGQYDAVPIEAPIEALRRYSCLVFLGWNTMTAEIYGKLKQYVKGGGHLVMFLPHLGTRTDRSDDLRLFHNGDFSDLFGVRVLGKGKTDSTGVKCVAKSSLAAYKFPYWTTTCDPMFLGKMTPARIKLMGARVISGHDNFFRATPEEVASRPILVENSLGKGKAFLVTAWEYPGDEGMRLFAEDILRTALAGEQGEIRLLSSDRVRYAVYDGLASGSRRTYRTVYLLNTDLDCSASARLWLRGRTTEPFDIPASDLRLAYCLDRLILIPEDRHVDLAVWKMRKGRHDVRLFSAQRQRLEIHNLGGSRLIVSVNGTTHPCEPGARNVMDMPRTVDPSRKEFFAPDFLEEPPVRYKFSGRSY
jgi:hypothetical protein